MLRRLLAAVMLSAAMPQDRQLVGSSPALPFLRPRRLLRFVAQQARHQTLSQLAPPAGPKHGARGRLGLVLRRPANA